LTLAPITPAARTETGAGIYRVATRAGLRPTDLGPVISAAVQQLAERVALRDAVPVSEVLGSSAFFLQVRLGEDHVEITADIDDTLRVDRNRILRDSIGYSPEQCPRR